MSMYTLKNRYWPHRIIAGLVVVNVLSACSGLSAPEANTATEKRTAISAPIADAGLDITVVEQSKVTLIGNGLANDGFVKSYSWLQTSGTPVTLVETKTSTLTFTTPSVEQRESLVFLLTVTDGDGKFAMDTVNVTVVKKNVASNSAPIISGSGTPQSATENSRYSFLPTATDADVGDTLVFSITNRPSWATFDSTTGMLTGTPPFTSARTYPNIIISVSDSKDSASIGPFSITVNNVNRAPKISGTPTTTVAENSPYSFVPSVTDPDTNDVQVFSIENKPSWATFDTNSGTLTGTPSFTSAGNYPDIKISVSDGTDSVSLGLFSITVTNMNGVPTISGVPPRSVAQGQSFEFTPVAVDPDGDTVSFSINTKLPAWLSFDPTTGRISGTPSINENGTTVANIVIAVTDVNMASARLPVFSITVCSACVLPNVLFTDIVSGPTSGGENDNGAYLNIFGTNFGPTAGLRTNTKVFINDVEVADYKFLGNAKAQPFVKNGTTIQHLAVQVGRIGGLAPGVAGAIKVVVAGVASNTDHTFINQPGDMIYVSLTGSDTTGDGSFARPYRKVQVATRDNPAWRAFGPGDTIVLRGGIWTDVGVEGRFVRIGREKSPTAPNGALGNGYSAFQAYPGENVTIDLKYAYGNHKGGFCGPPSDDNAFSHYFVFSGFNIRDDDPSKPTHSGTGPITSQSSGDHWRIVNNELTAKIGTITQKAGAISGGFRDAAILGNSIHDIEGLIVASKDPAMIAIGEDQEPLINHGMYFDNYNARVEVAYNHLKDISGGSGLQFFGNNGSVCGLPGCMLEELNIHHNVLENISGKYGLNFSWVVTSGTVYNNVVVHTKLPGLRLGSDHFSGMKVVNNSFYDVSYSGAYPAVFVDGNIFNNASNSDSIFVENNIIYASVTANGYYSYYNGAGSDSGVFMKNNLWFGKGLTPPSKDAGGKYGDPKYLSTSAGSEDLRIDTTSPAYNSAVVEASTYIPVNDASIQMRSGPLDIGAFEVQ